MLTEPLKELARSTGPFEWTERHQQVLDQVKQALPKDALGHYRPDWATEVVVDASPAGLGAILRQHDPQAADDRHVV